MNGAECQKDVMGRLLDLWCRSATLQEVRQWVTPHLRRSGFEGPLLVPSGSSASEKPYGWDLVQLRGAEIFAGTRSATEGCTVFALRTRADSDSGRPEFLMLWDAILRDAPSWLAEAILQRGTADVYPLLVHSFTRLQPLPIVNMDDDTARELRPRDEAYWQEIGPRLHFLADSLLAGPGVPAPEALAVTMAAGLERVRGGIVLNCGWPRFREESSR